eukprot:779611_1
MDEKLSQYIQINKVNRINSKANSLRTRCKENHSDYSTKRLNIIQKYCSIHPSILVDYEMEMNANVSFDIMPMYPSNMASIHPSILVDYEMEMNANVSIHPSVHFGGL